MTILLAFPDHEYSAQAGILRTSAWSWHFKSVRLTLELLGAKDVGDRGPRAKEEALRPREVVRPAERALPSTRILQERLVRLETYSRKSYAVTMHLAVFEEGQKYALNSEGLQAERECDRKLWLPGSGVFAQLLSKANGGRVIEERWYRQKAGESGGKIHE